ncbi:MAG TPA: IS5 family transposase, partial [Pyrinomonadaceae bacterium]|nr:IS5 family transposase [Pyrinomonadaceae bacterium]
QLLSPMLPPPFLVGRKREVDLREVMNAILYLLRSGCAWRYLPHDFPQWTTVYYYFSRWCDMDWFVKLNSELCSEVRRAQARDPDPSAAIIDSQSVKSTEQGGAKGYDAGKKVNGRKRHILVDTIGLLLIVKVLADNIQDRDAAKVLLGEIKERMPRFHLIWADGGYRGKIIKWVATTCLWLMQVVKRNDDVKGFKVLPRRWVVERTFAWLSRNRRLSKDYERLCETSEAWIYTAMIHLMLKRLRPLKI